MHRRHHSSWRTLLLLLAGTLCCVYSPTTAGPASTGGGSNERRSLAFPSLHHAKYQSIRFYAEPMHLSSARSSDRRTRKKLLATEPRQEEAQEAEPTGQPQHRHPVHALAQTYPFQTYLLRVKAPITIASRRALETYLHPYRLGHYVPHHSFLVTMEADAQKSSGARATEHQRWLRAAPGVLDVWQHEEHQKLHPRIFHAVKSAHARNRKRATLTADQRVEHDAAGTPQAHWSWTEFEPARDGGRWRKQFAAHGAPSKAPPPRDFTLVQLMVSLTPHPHHWHSPAGLIRAQPGTEEHEQHLAWEREAIAHAQATLAEWTKQLRQIELDAGGDGALRHEDLAPLDHSDREWLLRSGHASSPLRFEVSHSVHGADPQTELSEADLLLAKLHTPWHAHFTLATPTSVLLTSSTWFLPLLVRFLQHKREVHWVEPHTRPRTQNKFIRGILQADRGNTTPVWQAGLRGEGQIVQLGDTGLDTDSCFFSDPHTDVPVNTVDPAGRHRKLVTYQLFENADHGDDSDGHGSHVAGSLAGMVFGSEEGGSASDHPLAPFNGMAPQAKIAFYDFKRTGEEDLLVPPAVYKPYLGAAYSMGARVSSNSWGSPDAEYGSYCRELDQFAHDFADALIVFAAGNYGETGWNTVSSPGVAKNILTVGSTKTSPASFTEAGLDFGLRVLRGPIELTGQAGFSVVEGNFGMHFTDLKLQAGARLVVATPADACQPLRNTPAELDGAVVLVRRGVCHFGAKANEVQIAAQGKAPLMLVVNTEDGPSARMAGEPSLPTINLCAVMVTKSVGESLIAATLAAAAASSSSSSSWTSNTTVLISAPVLVSPPGENEWSLSSFSSRGPTFGGRLKPDVLAVGEFVRSVRSDGNLHSSDWCPIDVDQGILQLEGTSMATPIVAAAAALTRQYLMSGFYPRGVATEADVLVRPTSALVKALLIHSAMSASGDVLTKKASDAIAHPDLVQAAPSNMQGYGRVLLEHVLRFAENETNTNNTDTTTEGQQTAAAAGFSSSPLVSVARQLPNIELTDLQAKLESDQIHSFCYLVSLPPSPRESTADPPSAGNATSRATLPFFRATLVWTDAPVASGTSFVLVNNLDLFVSLPTEGKVFLGNALGFVDGTGRHESWDLENNVEQVSFDAPDSLRGQAILPVIVHVRGTNVPDGAQRYALVVTGWFNDSTSDADGATIAKHLPVGRCLDLAAGEGGESGTSITGDGLGILCPSNCGRGLGRGNRSYTIGVCACESAYAGDDCSQASIPLTHQGDWYWTSPAQSVPSDGWIYYTLVVPSQSEVRSSLSDLVALRFTMVRTSDLGDPDLFLRFGREWPSLRQHDLANTQCDSCATVDDQANVVHHREPSLVDVQVGPWLQLLAASPSADTIRIGVHGYCCDASAIQLTVEPIHAPRSPSVWLWLAPVLVLSVLLIVGSLLFYRRKQRRTAQGLDVLPVPMAASRLELEPDQPDGAPLRSPSRASRTSAHGTGGGVAALPIVRGQFQPLAEEEEQHLRHAEREVELTQPRSG